MGHTGAGDSRRFHSCAFDPDTEEYSFPTVSRVLDATELQSVLDAYAAVELGASGPCGSLSAPASLSVTNGRLASVTIGEDLTVIDEAGSCLGNYFSDGAWGSGVEALAQLVDELGR